MQKQGKKQKHDKEWTKTEKHNRDAGEERHIGKGKRRKEKEKEMKRKDRKKMPVAKG